MDPLELRFIVYRYFVEFGTAPSRDTLAETVGDLETVDALLRRLHERHMLVLDDRPHRRGEIRMALPFATEPTNFRVTTAKGAWWANCAWDSLATLAALHSDGRIDSTWSDTGERLELTVTAGELDSSERADVDALPTVVRGSSRRVIHPEDRRRDTATPRRGRADVGLLAAGAREVNNGAWRWLSAGLLGLLAACTSTSLSTMTPPVQTPVRTDVAASAPAPIAHSSDPSAVVLQVGDYHLGWGPDAGVTGPEIVLYGDGRLYAELFDGVQDGHATWSRVRGTLSESQVQALLLLAQDVPADPSMDTIAVDTFPTVIVSAAHRWELNDPEKEPFRSFLSELRSMVRRDAVEAWIPERWVVRVYPSSTCAITDAPATDPSYDAPVYPSLLDRLALGSVECYPAPAVEPTPTTSSGPAAVPGVGSEPLLGSAEVEPDHVRPGDTITITPRSSIQPICTRVALIWSRPGWDLLGSVAQNGVWTTAQAGADLSYPECLPPTSGAPALYAIPGELPEGEYSICLTINPSVDGCGPFVIDSSAPAACPVPPGEAAPRHGDCTLVDWDAIGVDGANLTIRYYVNDPGCSLDLDRVETTETDSAVSLRVVVGFTGDDGATCPTAYSSRTTVVALREPLASRELTGCRPVGSFVPKGGYNSPEPRSDAATCLDR